MFSVPQLCNFVSEDGGKTNFFPEIAVFQLYFWKHLYFFIDWILKIWGP